MPVAGEISEKIKLPKGVTAEFKKNKLTIQYIMKSGRLASFFIEVYFRTGEYFPRTLFFYPTSFDVVEWQNKPFAVPTSFLAGTFMNLERSSWPFVNTMLNAYLHPLIAMIRPVSDHFLAQQLAADEKEIEN